MSKCIIILFLPFFACTNQEDDYFLGKWQILSVVGNDQSITLQNNWIHLINGGTFESYDGDSNKTEKGTWTYLNSKRKIFIDGEGIENDSSWILALKNDTLIFTSETGDLYLRATRMKF